MSDLNHEKLSALVDGEHAPGLVDRLIANPQLKQTWSRYHIIGDCIRGHLPENLTGDVSSRIQSALLNEPTILAPEPASRFNLKPLAGFAIAASVALVAVLTVQKGNEIEPGPVTGTPAVAANSESVAPESQSFTFGNSQVLPAAVKKSDTPDSIANQRLNNYLMNHNEYRSNGNINGILPYVRIVTIESQE